MLSSGKKLWTPPGACRTEFVIVRIMCRSRHQFWLTSGWVVAALFFLFAGMVGASTEPVYIVKKSDSLWLIARHYGVSVNALARRNDLSLKETIYPGQRLRIPSKNAAGRRITLSPEVRKAIVDAKVRSGRWKYIVIHHSGTSCGTVEGMDEYHRHVRHMENGLAYHFVIGNGQGMKDGEIAVCHRWIQQLDGGHLASYALNKISLGICLVGQFDKGRPTRKQLDSLDALLRALLKRCSLKVDSIKTHQQINPIYTRCPGRHFDWKAVLNRLRR